jgi:hypothetical protein
LKDHKAENGGYLSDDENPIKRGAEYKDYRMKNKSKEFIKYLTFNN